MAILSTNALSIPITAAAAPHHCRRSLLVVRAAAAKCNLNQEPAASTMADDGAHASGRRRAMLLLAATAAFTVGSSAAICQQSARAAGVTTRSGQYVEIENVDNPYVQGVGEWAVEEHNRLTGESLRFGEVVRGMEQVVAGTNYKLDLATKDPTSSYQAVVFDPLPNSNERRQLKSFTPIVF